MYARLNLDRRTNGELISDRTTGIFESLRSYDGIIFRVEEHLDRFFESAKTLGLEIPESRSELKNRLAKSLRDSGRKDAFLRLTLVSREIFVLVTERTHPREIYERGVSLHTTAVKRNPSQAAFPEAKSTSCLNQVLGTLDPTPPGTYEILFLDSEGFLTEARIGNLFLIKKGQLLTPPPHGLLNGVTRKFVIECARFGKIPVEETPLTRHELFNADEAFLTNTSWEILPIREVDGRRVDSGIPAPLTKKLQAIFRRRLTREIKHGKN